MRTVHFNFGFTLTDECFYLYTGT